MEWCLYHPDYGYYRSEGMKIGRAGTITPALASIPVWAPHRQTTFSDGRGIGRWALRRTGNGGGEGCFVRIFWIGRKQMNLHSTIVCVISSSRQPPIAERTERKALPTRESGRVSWIRPEEFRNGKVGIEGCLLSNELVDAFLFIGWFRSRSSERNLCHRRGDLFEDWWGEPSDR